MVDENEDLLDILKEHGLSNDAMDMMKKIMSEKPKPFTKRWYRLKLKERLVMWGNRSENADWKHAKVEPLNVPLWEKAVEQGCSLYEGVINLKDNEGGEMEAYFLVPDNLKIVLIFFGDEHGFFPQYLQTTREKFAKYSGRLNQVLRIE